MANKHPFPRFSEGVSIRHSFSARLSLYVVLITSLVFIAASVIFFLFSKRIVKQEAVRHANSELSATVYQIEDVLHRVQAAASNMEWAVKQNLSQPDSLYRLTRLMIRNNPMIIGSSIAFEPFYYPEKGKMFAPYSYKDNDSILKDRQLGTVAYNYHEKDWYKTAKFQDRNYWSEPYFDEGVPIISLPPIPICCGTRTERYSVFSQQTFPFATWPIWSAGFIPIPVLIT